MATNITGIGIANAIGFKSHNPSGKLHYPGLVAAYTFAGKSNEDEDRDRIYDLVGNNHITISGLTFDENNGYNIETPSVNLLSSEYIITNKKNR